MNTDCIANIPRFAIQISLRAPEKKCIEHLIEIPMHHCKYSCRQEDCRLFTIRIHPIDHIFPKYQLFYNGSKQYHHGNDGKHITGTDQIYRCGCLCTSKHLDNCTPEQPQQVSKNHQKLRNAEPL